MNYDMSPGVLYPGKDNAPGGKSTHRLCPCKRAFQAEVARGSTCRPEPLRAGPITNHLRCKDTAVNMHALPKPHPMAVYARNIRLHQAMVGDRSQPTRMLKVIRCTDSHTDPHLHAPPLHLERQYASRC